MIETPHHLLFHLPRMQELGRLYWSQTITSFGVGLVSIFVPIYLLKLGYSLENIFLLYAVRGAAWAIFTYWAGQLIGRLGANRTMVLGLVAAGGELMLLPMLASSLLGLLALGIVAGFHHALYLTAYRASFSKAKSAKRAGQQVSRATALTILGGALAPAIGGVVAYEFGVEANYALAVALMLAAVVPHLRSPDVVKHRPPDLSRIAWHRIWRDNVANASYTIVLVAEVVVWSLLVYTIIPSYAGLGALGSLSALMAILVTLYVGKREATRGEKHYLKEGNFIMVGTTLLRTMAHTSGHVASSNIAYGLGNALTTTPYFSRYYQHADEEPRLEYIMSAQFANGFGNMVYFTLLMITALWFSDATTLLIGLLLTIPATLGIRLIR